MRNGGSRDKKDRTGESRTRLSTITTIRSELEGTAKRPLYAFLRTSDITERSGL
jgi:hypothetical protein